GWIECVGNADRSCFDLSRHSEATNTKLVAERHLAAPKTVSVVQCVPNKAVIGKTYKKEGAALARYLETLEDAVKFENEVNTSGNLTVEVSGKTYHVTKEMFSVQRTTKSVSVEDFTPSVIEPSFGIGRIMYAVFEHNFSVRQGDEARTFLSLPPHIAPYQCSVLPLSSGAQFEPFVQQISDLLRDCEISHKVDDSSGSIGRRYARTDEIGIPYGITVDFDTLAEPHTATLRDRDSMSQIRASIRELPTIVRSLCSGKITWAEVMNKYQKFEQQEKTSK
ncbi:unnamed protein product, partial [Soboliphyme baturini]|uniref:HGTP_anticodon domain-containing protein n=1 Tax=Soboliphyme baturini TaxID=241478 RepID=A0A183IRP5_9BILA